MAQDKASIRQLQNLIRDMQVGFSSFHALALEPHGVSLPQFAVLMCLAQERPRKMSDVAKVLRVSLPAITHLVDRLEEKKLIRREADPADRRVNLLNMTPRGLGLVAKTQGKTMRVLTRAYLRRRPSERRAVLEFMRDMRSGLTKAIKDVGQAK